MGHKISTLSHRAAISVTQTCSQILNFLIDHPKCRIMDVEMLSKHDTAQLSRWNSKVPRSYEICIHGIIQQHAEFRPRAEAVNAWDGDLSYSRLNKLSNILAHRLQRLGVGPNSLVLFCFDKSRWAVVATLAILKAGGAFVPLDPSHPIDRSKSIIRYVGAQVLLTSPAHCEAFEGLVENVITVSASSLWDWEDHREPRSNVTPQDAAFVIFTSGSTGQPKGIVQSHASVCTVSQAYAETLYMNTSSRVFQFAAYVFDVSTVDMYSTLMVGGCVCIPSEQDRRNDMARVMRDMRVNWADLTPSIASLLDPEDVPTLKTLVLAGEEAKSELVARWTNKVRLINCYGPAECGSCTAHEYQRSYEQPNTIGRALPCIICWVADPTNIDRLMPIGALGELVAEGPTLARGYLHDAEKTKTAFHKWLRWANMTESGSEHRLYRTGDLVRCGIDGIFSYAGRRDDQVKVRGQRVDLNEVQHHASTIPGLASCVILLPKAGPYAGRLVAVVELCSGTPTGCRLTEESTLELVSNSLRREARFDSSEAASHMSRKVPSYMLPAGWLAVHKIPLNSSRKTDRRAVQQWLERLQPEDGDFTFSKSSFSIAGVHNEVDIPSNDHLAQEVSSLVANITCRGDEKLRRTMTGCDFVLSTVGIDSIQVMTLSRLLRQRFGIQLDVEELTQQHLTIRGLAAVVERSRDIGYDGEASARSLQTFLQSQIQMLYRNLETDPARCTTMGVPQIATRSMKHVFLTGATGFLGTQILRQLLGISSVSRITVLVRARSPEDGMHRVVEAAEAARWWSESLASRVRAWNGDLSQARLGLGTRHWNLLVGDCTSPLLDNPDAVDTIIHAGATVRWNASYEALKSVNVDSTVELLRAVKVRPASSPVRFLYVSGGQQLQPGVPEKPEALRLAQAASSTGYSQTKLVAELLVTAFASNPALCGASVVTIMKPSYIIGTAQEGVTNCEDYLWRVVASALDVGAYNRDEVGSWLCLASADRVARAVLRSVSDECIARGSVSSIFDGLFMQDVWDVIIQELGCEMKASKEEEWLGMIREDVERKLERHYLWPVLEVFEKGRGRLGLSSAVINAGSTLDMEEEQKHLLLALRKSVGYMRSLKFL